MATLSFNPIDRDKELSRTITEAFGYIERYLEGLDQSSFLIDRKTQDAVSMRLQQILECSIKLSTETKYHLRIDWPSLIAMRNKVSHHYIDVDPKIIWEVVQSFDEFKKLINWAKKSL
jgi:uncharacterized protein with HEPN domain